MAKTILNVPITFNGVSVGKEKVSVGIGIDHARVSREQMGELFVNRQLDVDLVTGEPDEQSLPGIESDRVELTGTFTANSYSEKKDSFGTRLAIAKGETRSEDFWDLAGRSGWLTVHGSHAQDADGDRHEPLDGQMEFDEDGEPEEDEEPERAPMPSPVVNGSANETRDAVGAEERLEVPLADKTKHVAYVLVQEMEGGWWSGGWEWDGENDVSDDDAGETQLRRSRNDAIAAAAGQIIDSMAREPTPESKAGKDRRAAAIKAVKTFYSDAERGGKTVLETHSA